MSLIVGQHGIQDDPCTEKPFVIGSCDDAVPSWSHNPDTAQCEPFKFGGCGGSANRFATQMECEATCNVKPTDCCPPGEFCCGTRCLEDGTQTQMQCEEAQCCSDASCGCTEEYAPMCSTASGTTHSNLCMAQCAGDADSLTKGECPSPEPSDCCDDGLVCCSGQCKTRESITRPCLWSALGCCPTL
jgi:Kunitz/Bovine pancreatic trypsin inhibitor domain